ncbi:hypothetical protein BC828DRAFT_381437 [Blastocladiella britannica]|nr:hypothetical protein BC828DRAFT_381437 [Blastocladiella britannica]
MKPVISASNTLMLNLVSVCGILFMVLIGAFYDTGAPTLTLGHAAPPDAGATATSCYKAAIIYVVLLVFGLSQRYLHNRNPAVHF